MTVKNQVKICEDKKKATLAKANNICSQLYKHTKTNGDCTHKQFGLQRNHLSHLIRRINVKKGKRDFLVNGIFFVGRANLLCGFKSHSHSLVLTLDTVLLVGQRLRDGKKTHRNQNQREPRQQPENHFAARGIPHFVDRKTKANNA